MLGVTAKQSGDLADEIEPFLSNVQYDGKVDWPGALLRIRLIRFAHVYTKQPKRSLLHVLAAIGGQESLLMWLVR